MREVLEKHYETIKELTATSRQSREKLEKNRQAIMVDGKIPEKYQKAFSELERHTLAFESQLKSCFDVLGPIEEYYIFCETTSHLLFEKGDGVKPFVECVNELEKKYWAKLKHATGSFNIDELDIVLTEMRHAFIDSMFDKYIEYSKTLSFNRILA